MKHVPHFEDPQILGTTLMCVIPVVRVNYLKESKLCFDITLL
jgi:hypothetical protein